MKKFYYAFILLALATSCSTVSYCQIGVLSSDNVEMNDRGQYKYSQNELTISYNFWSYGGKVSFSVTNKTDNDIYLLMDCSHFINNGWAYDYYKNRVYTISESSSSSTRSTIGASANNAAQLNGTLNTSLSSTNAKYSGISVSQDISIMATESESYGSQLGYSVKFPESKSICIPAHSSKHFSEFQILDRAYRQCGFARDSKDTEGEKLTFPNANSSPTCIENRLVFKINGQIVPIVNNFYVKEYINILNSEGYAYLLTYRTKCNGDALSTFADKKIYKHAMRNSFYTDYTYNHYVDSNDRIDDKSQNILVEIVNQANAKQEEKDRQANAKQEEKDRQANAKQEEKDRQANAKQEEKDRLQAETMALEKSKRAEKIEKCLEKNLRNLQYLTIDSPTNDYTELGDNYFYGRNGKEFNIAKAFLCYNLGAKKGEAESFLRIGQYYETGRSNGRFYLEQNKEFALAFYEKAESLNAKEALKHIERLNK